MTASQTDSFIRQVTVQRQDITIDVEDPTFVALDLAPQVIARLRSFNAKDSGLRQAIFECAKKIEKNLPTRISDVLISGTLSSIHVSDWKRATCSQEELQALKKFGVHLASRILIEPTPYKRQHLEALADVHGIIILSGGAVDWNEYTVKDRCFCLVVNSSGLPVLHKSQSYDTLSVCRPPRWGSCWHFDKCHRYFNSLTTSDVTYAMEHVAPNIPISTKDFRVARLIEIIAMLSSVKCIAGLPQEYIE